MDQNHIDSLLERYLTLLDQYTSLRADLSALQSDVFQSLARANFQADRGMRFGPDHYDERMKAGRRLDITRDEQDPEWIQFAVRAQGIGLKLEEHTPDGEPAEKAKEQSSTSLEDDGSEGEGSGEKGDKSDSQREQEEQSLKRQASKDPLRWFGLFTPAPLARAQSSSIKVVEETIPRLLTVRSELLSVEIEVRRARKKRAKADAAANKSAGEIHNGTGVTA